LIFYQNGQAGLVGEHSLMDGQPIGAVIDWVINRELHREPGTLSKNEKLLPPEHLKWELSEELNCDLKTASINLDALINNTQITRLSFRNFGKETIKKFGVSPDGFVQAALQMAYYKTHGKFAPTYESTSTRKFRRGRTETGRTLTAEARAFIESLSDPTATKEVRRKLFLEGVNAHVAYGRDAGEGHGIDRHFLAFQLLAQEAGEPLHPLYSDPIFVFSKRWIMSTSQLDFSTVLGVAFGPVVTDGYGICYLLKDDWISFTITTWNSAPGNNVFTFKKHLSDSLSFLLELQNEKAKL